MEFFAPKRTETAKTPSTQVETREVPVSDQNYRDALVLFDAVVKDLQNAAAGIEVVDNPTQEHAVEVIGEAKRYFKKIEAKRKELVGPHNDYVRSVNRFAKQFTESLRKIEADLKAKIGAHVRRQELERRKREAEMRRRQEEIERKLKADAKKAGVKMPDMPPPPVVNRKPETVRTENAVQSVRMEWTFSVENFAEVPRRYMMVDEKSIRSAIKAGIRDIPGLKIYEAPIVSVRT